MPWLWIAATSVGMGAGLAVGAAVVDYSIDRADLMLMGAITGLGVGVLQALVLARQGLRRSGVVGSGEPADLGPCLADQLLRDLGEHR